MISFCILITGLVASGIKFFIMFLQTIKYINIQYCLHEKIKSRAIEKRESESKREGSERERERERMGKRGREGERE